MKLRVLCLALILTAAAQPLRAACCYFSALEKDVKQPGQKAFITWDPGEKWESFTVQPAFEGDARDFGMVVPTPSVPTLDEMPRDFFKHLAIYTILLPTPRRMWPPQWRRRRSSSLRGAQVDRLLGEVGSALGPVDLGVKVLETGVVGSLDYKVLEATRPKGLYEWLDLNGYSYAGDEETLKHYIDQEWNFTVMKIDAKQMKVGPGGDFTGQVTPTRFSFRSSKLVYPLRITRPSVEDKTEAIFYVQAPEQMDLQDDWSWTWSYRLMWLRSGTVCISRKVMTPAERAELSRRQSWLTDQRRKVPSYDTTKLEWAHRIGEGDKLVLADPVAHFPQLGVPDLPEGARVVSWDEFRAEASKGAVSGFVARVRSVFSEYHPDSATLSSGSYQMLRNQYPPEQGVIVRQEENEGTVWYWFPNREAPAEDVSKLGQLKGILEPGAFLTKFRKTFQKGEMARDLEIVPAEEQFRTEYLRILPTSPP